MKDYRLNELYASQWIELYLDQSMKSSGQNIKAEATIAVLVSNNKILLEKQITKETIEKFINLCKEQEKDERFVLLLATLCSCLDEAIISNQNNIIELILENDETKNILVMPIKDRSEQVDVGLEAENSINWINLRDFKNYSQRHDNLRLYKYYIAFIDLMAEMCLQRNHRAINSLTNSYSLNAIYKAIIHPALENQMKGKFLKLLYNMYVDKEPFGDLQVPNYTRVWTEISPFGNRIQYYRQELPEYLNKIKSYVITYLKSTNGIQSIFDQHKNAMTLEVIKLAKCMVSYGFYKTKDELREISLALITLLNGVNDIYELQQDGSEPIGLGALFQRFKSLNIEDKEPERYKKTEDNLIIMKCKQYICDILIKVLDIENDLKVSLFLGFFKEEVENLMIADVGPEENDFVNATSSKVFPLDNRLRPGQNYEDDPDRGLLAIASPQKPAEEDDDAVHWLEKVLMGEQLFDAYPQSTYICILVDLLSYKHEPLYNKSLELIIRYFNQRQKLIEILKQIQLLEHPESIKTLNKVNSIISELKNF